MKEHKKTVPETGVKSDLAFCLKSLIAKTNSDTIFFVSDFSQLIVSIQYSVVPEVA